MTLEAAASYMFCPTLYLKSEFLASSFLQHLRPVSKLEDNSSNPASTVMADNASQDDLITEFCSLTGASPQEVCVRTVATGPACDASLASADEFITGSPILRI